MSLVPRIGASGLPQHGAHPMNLHRPVWGAPPPWATLLTITLMYPGHRTVLRDVARCPQGPRQWTPTPTGSSFTWASTVTSYTPGTTRPSGGCCRTWPHRGSPAWVGAGPDWDRATGLRREAVQEGLHQSALPTTAYSMGNQSLLTADCPHHVHPSYAPNHVHPSYENLYLCAPVCSLVLCTPAVCTQLSKQKT